MNKKGQNAQHSFFKFLVEVIKYIAQFPHLLPKAFINGNITRQFLLDKSDKTCFLQSQIAADIYALYCGTSWFGCFKASCFHLQNLLFDQT